MLIERGLILILALALTAAGVCLWRCFLQRKLARLAESGAPQAVRDLVSDHAPAILYFTTAECAQCRFQQSPILDQLTHRVRVAVYTIDAVAQQELASFYGVMTVPSTVVLNPQLQPVAVNHGLATPELLTRQLASVNG